MQSVVGLVGFLVWSGWGFFLFCWVFLLAKELPQYGSITLMATEEKTGRFHLNGLLDISGDRKQKVKPTALAETKKIPLTNQKAFHQNTTL